MTLNGCVHLSNFKEVKGVDPYRTIHSFFVACTTYEAREIKQRYCHCYVCKSEEPRLHACIYCIFFGCYNGHIQDHGKTKKHYLAVDLIFGNILCFLCKDYIYDSELFEIAREHRDQARISLGITLRFNKWEPGCDDLEVLKKNPRKRQLIPNSTLGLRGLFNLGNTCYMNCIVQVLVHTPVLRDYFLADEHECRLQEPGLCLVCEIGDVFQQFYRGEKEPLILLNFLKIIWSNAEHLVGIEQQDAHEFFIIMLNVLHRDFKANTDVPLVNGQNRCSCIVDRIFTGGLQSDVVCQSCKGVSTTVELFRDISLEIGASNHDDVKSSRLAASSQSDDKNSTLNRCPLSLVDCLKQYTRAEHLGTGEKEKIKCIKCEAYKESTKQITIQTLPIVVCFHLKRFRAIQISESEILYKKISTVVSFPSELDMTPFLSHHRNRTSDLDGECCKGHLSIEDNRYSLFAVVNHKGTFHGGHYTTFVRQQHDQWYTCSDRIISPIHLRDVLKCEGYLLFYHKRILEYE